MAVALAGPNANHLHLSLDKQSCQHLVTQFYRPDAFPDAQSTVLKHWGQTTTPMRPELAVFCVHYKLDYYRIICCIAVHRCGLLLPIEMPFGLRTLGPGNHVLDGGSISLMGRGNFEFNRIRQVAPMCSHGRAHCHDLANTVEPSVCGGDVALCQITLTTCYKSCYMQRLNDEIREYYCTWS